MWEQAAQQQQQRVVGRSQVPYLRLLCHTQQTCCFGQGLLQGPNSCPTAWICQHHWQEQQRCHRRHHWQLQQQHCLEAAGQQVKWQEGRSGSLTAGEMHSVSEFRKFGSGGCLGRQLLWLLVLTQQQQALPLHSVQHQHRRQGTSRLRGGVMQRGLCSCHQQWQQQYQILNQPRDRALRQAQQPGRQQQLQTQGELQQRLLVRHMHLLPGLLQARHLSSIS